MPSPTPTHRRKSLGALAILLAILAILGLASIGPAGAVPDGGGGDDTVQNGLRIETPNVSECPNGGLKLNDIPSGQLITPDTYELDGLEITIVSSSGTQGSLTFAWTSNLTLASVLVKGGTYTDSFTGGTSGTVTFTRNNWYSHISFCLPAPAADVCDNLDGVQATIPDGYESDGNGGCTPIDLCDNIDGNQTTVPDGKFVNDDGDCITDVCDNLDGGQATIPTDYESDGNGGCTPIEDDPCQYDDTIPASSEDCVEPCASNPDIPADDPSCGATPQCETDCGGDGGGGGGGGGGRTVTDVCDNLAGTQDRLPDGMVFDAGDCVPEPDACSNLDGTQAEVPDGMVTDGAGACVEPLAAAVDVCSNLPGSQQAVPANMSTDADGRCLEGEVLAEVITQPTPTPAQLPRTGSDPSLLVHGGLVLIGSGSVLGLLGHRRRRSATTR